MNREALRNPAWSALRSGHARLGTGGERAKKYREDVAPFGATAENDAASLAELMRLLAPGERTYVLGGELPEVAEMRIEESIAGYQMALGGAPASGGAAEEVSTLGDGDAAAMVELTSVAYPGFFRARTCEMGAYYGIWEAGELVAMAGERMAPEDWREISGVCTRPGHTGKGYARRLIGRIVERHRQLGLGTFLHVAAENRRAVALYEALGFRVERELFFHRAYAVEDEL